MESTKTFVEHPSGKLAVTVHAPRSLREEEAAYWKTFGCRKTATRLTSWIDVCALSPNTSCLQIKPKSRRT